MDGELSAAELEALLGGGEDDLRIVDIRNRAAFDRGHIPGSENIPFQELPQRVEALDGADRVVTVCPHGQASQQAARLVGSYEGIGEDARVESLACGIEGWPGDLEQTVDDDDDDDEDAGADVADEGPETDAPF